MPRTTRKRRPSSQRREALVEDAAVADLPAPEDESTLPNDFEADYQLAQRCATGEVLAWEELHSQCHFKLVATIRRLLSGRSNDANLAEEIAARVWYALVDKDGELLLRYDPNCGARLITFMRTIARDIMCRHFRSERRRSIRECEALRDYPRHYESHFDLIDISLDEFLATLAPGEREFCREYLLSSPDEDSDSPSDSLTRTNFWQKTHRVYKQFVQFFDHDT